MDKSYTWTLPSCLLFTSLISCSKLTLGCFYRSGIYNLLLDRECLGIWNHINENQQGCASDSVSLKQSNVKSTEQAGNSKVLRGLFVVFLGMQFMKTERKKSITLQQNIFKPQRTIYLRKADCFLYHRCEWKVKHYILDLLKEV